MSDTVGLHRNLHARAAGADGRWHPFLEHSPITLEQGIFIGYRAIAWMYLIAPLVGELALRARSAVPILARQEINGLRF